MATLHSLIPGMVINIYYIVVVEDSGKLFLLWDWSVRKYEEEEKRTNNCGKKKINKIITAERAPAAHNDIKIYMIGGYYIS
jgi:hypothetical protein